MVPQFLTDISNSEKDLDGTFITIGGPVYDVHHTENDTTLREISLSKDTIADMLTNYFLRNLAYCS